MMLLIQKSTIEGRGLFTGSPIAARTKVGELKGEHIAVREARRRARNRKHIAIVELNYKEAIDGCVRGGPFRYINHSCSPNVFIRVAYDKAEFYAKRDIAAGEEMTVDYGVSHHNGQLRCKCKSLHCRDFI